LGLKESLLTVYDVHYKKLVILSFVLFFVCLASLFVGYARTGEFFEKGVSLKGGITMTIPIQGAIDGKTVERLLSERFPEGDITVREIVQGGRPTALIVEAADVPAADLEGALPEVGVALEKGEYSVESMGSALGQRFFTQVIKALIFAFIAMGIVVFLTFRSIVPSAFVVLAALSDIVSTLAVINLIGMKVSTAGIASLLMLIGYSVDTDIVLTTRVLKRRGEGGNVFQRTIGAMKTGGLMTLTALAATIIAATFTTSDSVKQIMIIITIGLLFDLIYTWFQNAGILRWYMERKYGKS